MAKGGRQAHRRPAVVLYFIRSAASAEVRWLTEKCALHLGGPANDSRAYETPTMLLDRGSLRRSLGNRFSRVRRQSAGFYAGDTQNGRDELAGLVNWLGITYVCHETTIVPQVRLRKSVCGTLLQR
jgi:hypothetical protein